jgi:hypothetical protein
MALASTGLPCALTDNSSTARTRLGDLYGVWDPTYGHQVWRYVQNKSGGSFTQGLGVMQENGTDLYEATLSGAATANARMLGVAQHTITDAYFGFVLADGVGVIKAAVGGITANAGQKAVANGLFDAATIGTDEIPVHALEAAASGLTARAHIRCL